MKQTQANVPASHPIEPIMKGGSPWADWFSSSHFFQSATFFPKRALPVLPRKRQSSTRTGVVSRLSSSDYRRVPCTFHPTSSSRNCSQSNARDRCAKRTLPPLWRMVGLLPHVRHPRCVPETASARIRSESAAATSSKLTTLNMSVASAQAKETKTTITAVKTVHAAG